MNTGSATRSNASRYALLAPAALCLVSVAAIVVVLTPFLDGSPDHRIAQPLGAPVTAAALLAVVVATAWWTASGDLRVGRRAFLSAALLALPLCGVLAAAQGAEPDVRFLGGLAGRNLVYPFFSNGVGSGAPLVVYGLALLFGVYFARRATGTSGAVDDPSAILARLSQRRVGKNGDAPEVPAPFPDEAVGVAMPVGNEPDLFAPDAELAATPGAEDREIPTAFTTTDEAEEEPPPPPRRRRVLEGIVAEEEFEAAARSDRAAVASVDVSESIVAFGAVVVEETTGGAEPVAADVGEIEERGSIIDVDDDEDVLAETRRDVSDDEESEGDDAAEPPRGPDDDAPFGAGVDLDRKSTDATPDDDEVESAATNDAAETPRAAAPPIASETVASTTDDRERLEDAVDLEADAGGPADDAEVERPLFPAPPRVAPGDDDYEVDDLPTGDDDDASMGSSDDAVGTPPKARPYEATGGRTGEAPNRAIVASDATVDAETEAPAEATAAATESAEAADRGLFPDADPTEDAAAPIEAEAKPARRRAARRPKVEADDDAPLAVVSEASASADADSATASAIESDAADGNVEADTNAGLKAPPAPRTPEPVRTESKAPVVTPNPTPSRAARAAAVRVNSDPKDDFEALVSRAAQTVIEAQRCSPSLLQRELGVRFVEAAAIIERLHARGVVGPHTPSGVRDVLVRATGAEA